jgi:3-oxoacyl-[acyl-carrier protein] reductase
MFELTGKTALVTGSSRGIGRGIALGLAKAGANVAVNSVHITDATMELVERIRAMGRKCVAIGADVSRESEVDRLFAETLETFGGLDILVNNAGISREETVFDITPDSWHQVIDTNLTSTFLCAKKAMETMREQAAPGRIIQITSLAGHQGAVYGHVHYAASKSGQIGLTKTLARTGAPYGITVNAIAPGIIDSDLLHRLHGEEKVKALTDAVPLGLGTPEDIAHAAVYLASDEARYVTGVTLDVNGGIYFR